MELRVDVIVVVISKYRLLSTRKKKLLKVVTIQIQDLNNIESELGRELGM